MIARSRTPVLKRILALWWVVWFLVPAGAQSIATPDAAAGRELDVVSGRETVQMPAGLVRTVIRIEGLEYAPVATFRIDRYPVSAAEFREFIAAEPRWRRSRVPALFASGRYLFDWESDDRPPGEPSAGTVPATRISWYAASAYCRWVGGRLPTEIEWEYAFARAMGSSEPERANGANRWLQWYADPMNHPGLSEAGSVGAVVFVHGLEWVEDYQAAILGAGIDPTQLGCGVSAQIAAPRTIEDWAAFTRFSARSSLAPNSATATVGFRCAYDF